MEGAERAERGYACLLAWSARSLPARIGEPGSGSSQVHFQTAPAGFSVGWKKQPDLVFFLLRELLLGQQFMRGATLSPTPIVARDSHMRAQPLVLVGLAVYSAQNSGLKAMCFKRRATSDSEVERVEKS